MDYTITRCLACGAECDIKRIYFEAIDPIVYGKDPGSSTMVEWAVSDCCDDTLVDEDGTQFDDKGIEMLLKENYGGYYD